MVTVTPVIEKVFKPNEGKQSIFLSLPDSIFEAFYGGAAGGGKSLALMLLPILRGWHEHPKFHGLILRRTYPELEEYMILNSAEYYKPAGGKYDKQQKRYRFYSGAIIKFGHCEEEQDVRKYDTSEYNYIAFDELTSFTEFQYRFLTFSRCRSSCPDLPAIVRSGSNPGNIGHGWVRDRFVEPCRQGMKIIAEKAPDGKILKRIFIPAKVKDNLHITDNDPTYITRMQFLPESERKAKMEGDWWTFSGQVFSEFRNDKFPNEPENALHVCDPLLIPSHVPRILAIDWGFTNMTYAIWGGVLSSGRVVIEKEYSECKKTVKEWSTDIANLSMENPPCIIAMDPSAWQNRGQDGTIAGQFITAWHEIFQSDPPLVKADNDRIGGKLLVHDFLRWKILPDLEIEKFNQEKAQWILQSKGLVVYQKYLSTFKVQQNPEILPRLLISKLCPLLIDTIKLCVYDAKKVEDVAEFKKDDPYDTLRYFLKAAKNYFDSATSNEAQYNEEMKVVKAVEVLKETSDMTSFYRKMEKLELEKNNYFAPRRIGRFRGYNVSSFR